MTEQETPNYPARIIMLKQMLQEEIPSYIRELSGNRGDTFYDIALNQARDYVQGDESKAQVIMEAALDTYVRSLSQQEWKERVENDEIADVCKGVCVAMLHNQSGALPGPHRSFSSSFSRN